MSVPHVINLLKIGNNNLIEIEWIYQRLEINYTGIKEIAIRHSFVIFQQYIFIELFIQQTIMNTFIVLLSLK
jgi:hypothetical protein